MTLGSNRNLDRLALSATLVGIALLAGPFFLGDGVDVPDDALYSTVSTWEALRFAIREGEPIWWLPYRMGGASLYSEAMQMGPFYPAMWIAFVLPVSIALPLAFLLHAVGTLFTVRWAALGFGVSPPAATLAGAAVVLGPLGAAVFIECQTDTWPVLMWLPVIFGATHRSDGAESARERWGWVALAGLGLGMMLLGAHLRHCAGACGALGIWFVLRRTGPAGLLRAGALTVLGLAIGALSWLPGALEWREAASGGGLMPGMSVPPYQSLQWTALASWLAPKPFVTAREFALGTVAATAFLAGMRATRTTRNGHARGRLAILVGVLLFIAADFPIPVLSYLWLPFKLLAHPVTIIYYAVAMIPASIVAAAGIDRLASADRGELRALLRGPAGILGAVLVAAVALRVGLGTVTLASPYEWAIYSVGAFQAALVLFGMGWVLRETGAGEPRRLRLLVVIAIADLIVFGVRYHTAIPSRPLRIAQRGDHIDLEPLRGGYLNIQEAVAFEEDGIHFTGHLQTATATGHAEENNIDEVTGEAIDFDEEGGEVELLEEEAPMIQEELLTRTWPVHFGARFGLRSLSGRTKLPSARAVVMLVPLVEALAPQWEGEPYESRISFRPETHIDTLNSLFLDPDGIGARTLALHGIRAVVGDHNDTYVLESVVPRCYSPTSFEVVPVPGKRVRRLLNNPFAPDGPALLEVGPPPFAGGTSSADVECEEDGLTVDVSTPTGGVVVLRERYHSGWTVTDETGAVHAPFPVNQVHMGVVVLEGDRRLTWSFLPPGVRPAQGALLVGLLLAATGIGRGGIFGRLR
jgi:hypothetical protein